MALSNAERQRRYQDRAREALRNAKAAATDPQPGAPSPSLAPLRLLGQPKEEDEPERTEMEYAAWDIMDLLVFKGRDRSLVTRHADNLIALIERDPADMVHYIRRYLAEEVAAFEQSHPKRAATKR
jgi:hypothetical protein